MGQTPTNDQTSVDPRTGLVVTVLRAADGRDCTLGGISSRYNTLTVVGIVHWEPAPRGVGAELVYQPMPRDCQVSHADPKSRPAVLLYRRTLHHRVVWAIVPALDVDTATAEIRSYVSGLMMSGNFAHTPDSRFTELTGMYGAVAIHDRIERHR